jgi:hypothetical protein
VSAASLVTGLALVGKATIVSCFCTIFIYSSELFPTVIRSVGVGTCTFFGRLGSLLAPQVRLHVIQLVTFTMLISLHCLKNLGSMEMYS